MAVAAGSYAEDVEIWNKAVRLWGVCPAQVELAGVGDYAALSLRHLTEPAEVGGIAVTGTAMGIIMMDVAGVRVDRVWIHDTDRRGLEAEDTDGPATMTVRDSLIEGVQLLGLSVFGATTDVEDTVVRDTQPRTTDGASGMGVAAFPGTESGARSSLTLRNFLVERNHQAGISAGAADVTLEGVVVRDTRSNSDQIADLGVSAGTSSETNEPSIMTLRGSLIDGNRHMGISVSASDALIETTSTPPRPTRAATTATGST